MQLFFQLNMNELPEPVRFEFGNGLLQMFYCCNWGCEGESEDNLPYMFGDVGIGHVLQYRTHKEQLAFIWACS